MDEFVYRFLKYLTCLLLASLCWYKVLKSAPLKSVKLMRKVDEHVSIYDTSQKVNDNSYFIQLGKGLKNAPLICIHDIERDMLISLLAMLFLMIRICSWWITYTNVRKMYKLEISLQYSGSGGDPFDLAFLSILISW